MKKFSLIAAAVAILATPLSVLADSDVNTAAGPNSKALANLDFSVVIPRVIFLQIGTGTNLADNAVVDQVTFTVPAANLGDGTDVAGSGAVTVRVFGNNGAIGLTATTAGLLTSGTDTLPWSEIKVVSTAAGAPAAGYLGVIIPHPAFDGAAGVAGTSSAVAVNSGTKVVRKEAVWTFAYDNTVGYAAGTYGAGGGTNGRVLYTATLP